MTVGGLNFNCPRCNHPLFLPVKEGDGGRPVPREVNLPGWPNAWVVRPDIPPKEAGLWPPAGWPQPLPPPLLPPHTVLFPDTTLPLHVFEPRYREMIGRCLEHDESFGIALILDGDEVGGHAIPQRIGTEAAIIACQRNSHGEYDIVVQGQRRFAIRPLGCDARPNCS